VPERLLGGLVKGVLDEKYVYRCSGTLLRKCRALLRKYTVLLPRRPREGVLDAEYTYREVGWLRLVGSLNHRSLLQDIVSLIGRFCKRDDILQKRPVILRSRPIILRSRPIILRSRPIILRSRPIILRSRPIILRSRLILASP